MLAHDRRGTFRAIPRDGHERMRLGLDEVRGRDAHRPLWLLSSVIADQLGQERDVNVEVRS